MPFFAIKTYVLRFFLYHEINQQLNNDFCLVVYHKNIITDLTCDSQLNRYDKRVDNFYFLYFFLTLSTKTTEQLIWLYIFPEICYKCSNKIRSTAPKKTQFSATERDFWYRKEHHDCQISAIKKGLSSLNMLEYFFKINFSALYIIFICFHSTKWQIKVLFGALNVLFGPFWWHKCFSAFSRTQIFVRISYTVVITDPILYGPSLYETGRDPIISTTSVSTDHVY